LTLLGSNVFAAPFFQNFRVNSRKFEDTGSTEHNVTDETEVVKERVHVELLATTLGRHVKAYK